MKLVWAWWALDVSCIVILVIVTTVETKHILIIPPLKKHILVIYWISNLTLYINPISTFRHEQSFKSHICNIGLLIVIIYYSDNVQITPGLRICRRLRSNIQLYKWRIFFNYSHLSSKILVFRRSRRWWGYSSNDFLSWNLINHDCSLKGHISIVDSTHIRSHRDLYNFLFISIKICLEGEG